MRILITGGAGFIGSHLAQRLLAEGHAVTVVDDLNEFYSPRLKLDNLAEMRQFGTPTFVQSDICLVDEMMQTVRESEPEIVYHLAARSGVRPSLTSPFLYERENIHGTLCVLEACRQASVPRFVFASSSSVYGNSDTTPFSEVRTPVSPVSPYAATKICGEALCRTYSHLYGINVVCLRLFSVYGPRQRPDLVIHKFTQRIVDDVPIPVFGNGTSARDYTYVSDIVDGLLAAQASSSPFEIINLGNSAAISLVEVITTLESALNKKAKIEYLPPQLGDVHTTYADISIAAKVLGYRPQVPFSIGVHRFVEWFMRSPAARPL